MGFVRRSVQMQSLNSKMAMVGVEAVDHFVEN